MLTSPHNPRVKAAARLRERKGRDEQGRIIIDGVREIGLALTAGVAIVELYFVAEHCQTDPHAALLQRAQQAGIERIEVAPPLMEKLAFGNRVEGLVAVALPPSRSLADLQLLAEPLVVVVERVEKPGNLGAILRTADAAGASALVVADGGTDLFNPNAIRASLGAIFTVPTVAASTTATLEWLRAEGFAVWAARVDAPTLYTAADFRGRTALVLGSEAAGLSPQWQASNIRPIRLPLLGRVDSLNLSATAAVLLYEALRQRQAPRQQQGPEQS